MSVPSSRLGTVNGRGGAAPSHATQNDTVSHSSRDHVAPRGPWNPEAPGPRDTGQSTPRESNGRSQSPTSIQDEQVQQQAASSVGEDPPGNRGPAQKRVGAQLPAFESAAKKVLKVNRFRKHAFSKEEVDNLCSICHSLELSAEKFIVKDRSQFLREAHLSHNIDMDKSKKGQFEVGSVSGNYELGTYSSIWDRSLQCSLCRLVVRSLGQQPNIPFINKDARRPSTARTNEDLNSLCYASWQIDGRELIRAPSGTVIASKARTRRIRIHWQDKHYPDAYLVLVSQSSLASSNLFLGRRVESAKSNPALIKSWIETCNNHHGDRCKVMHDSKFRAMIGQAYFGVIDVQEMRLSKLPEDAHFVALSYTWGKPDLPFKTTLKIVRQLQENRGIEKVSHMLPLSIRGAMDLVRELGERYFWVDSLCIVQDSMKSWELNAKVMDLVYGNAYLTIIAADGDSPNAGLIAMDPSQRHLSQHMEEYAPGVLLMVSHLAEEYIKKSAWNTRAWTFQERLLSKRCVIFVEGRVFFQCRSAAMREDIISEEQIGWSIEHAHAPLQILDNLETRALEIYMKSVELYTKRELTKTDDILSAFTGIGNLVGKTLGAGLIFGLPRSHFDLALLWEPKGAAKERNPLNFPSWSWCGWIGEVIEYKTATTLSGTMIDVHDWLMKHTWITWYIRDGYGNLKLLWKPKASRAEGMASNRWDGYQRHSATCSNLIDAYGRSKEHRWPEWSRDTFTKTLKDVPFGVGISTDVQVTEETGIQFPDQHFLQFWTLSAYLRLTDHNLSNSPSVGNNLKRFGIADYKSDWCGTIVLPDIWASKCGPGLEYEFLAISEAKEFSMEEHESWMYYIPREREQSEWDLYYVLLIEVREEIAYRVGLGKVYKEAFSNSCREEMKWKEFILG